jgi:hypothetical protein
MAAARSEGGAGESESNDDGPACNYSKQENDDALLSTVMKLLDGNKKFYGVRLSSPVSDGSIDHSQNDLANRSRDVCFESSCAQGFLLECKICAGEIESEGYSSTRSLNINISTKLEDLRLYAVEIFSDRERSRVDAYLQLINRDGLQELGHLDVDLTDSKAKFQRTLKLYEDVDGLSCTQTIEDAISNSISGMVRYLPGLLMLLGKEISINEAYKRTRALSPFYLTENAIKELMDGCEWDAVDLKSESILLIEDCGFPKLMNWQGLISKFPRILPAIEVHRMSEVMHCQHIFSINGIEKLAVQGQPLLVLFVSHEWETSRHPDPTGRQLKAIKKLLKEVVALMVALLSKDERFKRLDLMPDLLMEGTVQAAYIIRCLLDEMDRRGSKGDVLEAFSDDPWSLLTHIGIFYDYMCLPQTLVDAGVIRYPDEEAEFRESLRHLEDLAVSSLVIALRFDGDTFDSRAWCTVEFDAFLESYSDDYAKVNDTVLCGHLPVPLFADHWGELMWDLQNKSEWSYGKYALLTDLAGKLERFAMFWKHEALNTTGWDDFNVSPLASVRQIGDTACELMIFARHARHNVSVRNFTGKTCTCNSIARTIDWQLLEQWISVGPVDDDVVNLGKLVSLNLRVMGLVCRSDADLTFLGLTICATNPSRIFVSFFRRCLDAWNHLPEQQENFCVRLSPIHLADNLEDKQEHEWWDLRENPQQLMQFLNKHFDASTDDLAATSFCNKFCNSLHFHVPQGRPIHSNPSL